MTYTHLSLFTGIGGIDVAAEEVGFETIAQVEWALFPRAVLRKRFPNVTLWRDVRAVSADDVRRLLGGRRLHLLSGGYPCQPFSLAGRRSGTEDERHLWPHMFRLIRELKPAFVLGENVKGHVTLGLDDVLDDLEGEGYAARAFVLPAAATGAPHQRERVFVVAVAPGIGGNSRSQDDGTVSRVPGDWSQHGDPNGHGEARTGAQAMADAVCAGRQQESRGAFGDEGPNEGWTAVDNHLTTGRRESGTLVYTGSGGQPRGGTEPANSQPGPRHQTGVADPEGDSERSGSATDGATSERRGRYSDSGSQRGRSGTTQPRLGGATDGIRARLDSRRWPAGRGAQQEDWEAPRTVQGGKYRKDRLMALGNAVVPAQVYPILAGIMAILRGEAHLE